MSECLNPTKEKDRPLTKCTESYSRSSLHDDKITCSDNSNRQETEPESSENKNRQSPNNNEILVQYIHFNLNKNGCLE